MQIILMQFLKKHYHNYIILCNPLDECNKTFFYTASSDDVEKGWQQYPTYPMTIHAIPLDDAWYLFNWELITQTKNKKT